MKVVGAWDTTFIYNTVPAAVICIGDVTINTYFFVSWFGYEYNFMFPTDIICIGDVTINTHFFVSRFAYEYSPCLHCQHNKPTQFLVRLSSWLAHNRQTLTFQSVPFAYLWHEEPNQLYLFAIDFNLQHWRRKLIKRFQPRQKLSKRFRLLY